MRTDIVIVRRDRRQRLVIDTKLTGVFARGWYRDQTLRAGYVYQLYAYLRSQEGRTDPTAPRADSASGLLLHPAIDTEVDESVQIQGHRLRFAIAARTNPLWAPLATVLDRQPAADGRPLDPALHDDILLITILVAFLEATAQQLRPFQPLVVMRFGGIAQ
jgi:hypothetical protein